MKLGLDSYSYHLAFGAHPDFCSKKKMDIFQFMDKVIELKLDGFQIDPMHLASKEERYLQDVSAYANEKMLFLEYGAMGVEYEYLKQELEICSKLGSPVLRTFVGFNRYDKNVLIKDEIENAVLKLRKIKQQAEIMNIKIAIENHGDLNSDELISVVQKIDSTHIGICLDLGNAMFTFEDPLTAAEKMAAYTFTTHFKDYAVEMTNYGMKVKGVVLGDGNIDLQKALKILQQKTNLDKIILEIPVEAGVKESETLQKEEYIIERSVDYARNVLGIFN
jgi:3-oxoisoapionate decarboxylase